MTFTRLTKLCFYNSFWASFSKQNHTQMSDFLVFRERSSVEPAFPVIQRVGAPSSAVMTNFLLGLDVGTTSVKAVLLATDSRTVSASHALPTAADLSPDGGMKVSKPC